jgi:hypothetical protein
LVLVVMVEPILAAMEQQEVHLHLVALWLLLVVLAVGQAQFQLLQHLLQEKECLFKDLLV